CYLGCRAVLRASKTVVPPSSRAGTYLNFTNNATNDGVLNGTGIVVKDYLPSGYSYVSNTAGASFSGGTLTWNIGNLNNAASTTLQIIATTNTSGNFLNVAEITAVNQQDYDSDPNNYNGQPLEDDEGEATVTVPNCSDGNA